MTSNTPYFKTLMAHLHKQESYTHSFIHVLDQEQAGLLKMGMTILMQISKQKENGLRQMIYLDEQIQEVAAALIGPDTERDCAAVIQLSDLSFHLQPEEAEELEIMRQTLVRLRAEIDRKSYINHSFTQDTLRYLGDAIALISDGVATDPTYSCRGHLARMDKAGPSLLSREV
ncbi:MAG: flagellar export chaperone FlgN [Deltaproteobacteria bacterium]|jgi:flagellar biosynthesis/type III secretory pathway chaperone|nr:flagellar export chaperone FlgN [Deltaproteobacteria bacterium]